MSIWEGLQVKIKRFLYNTNRANIYIYIYKIRHLNIQINMYIYNGPNCTYIIAPIDDNNTEVTMIFDEEGSEPDTVPSATWIDMSGK